MVMAISTTSRPRECENCKGVKVEFIVSVCMAQNDFHPVFGRRKTWGKDIIRTSVLTEKNGATNKDWWFI